MKNISASKELNKFNRKIKIAEQNFKIASDNYDRSSIRGPQLTRELKQSKEKLESLKWEREGFARKWLEHASNVIKKSKE